MTLPDRIKKIRKDNNLNQLEFGKRIGLSESAICNYESGRRDVSKQSLLSICREFKVNADWLIEEKGNPYLSDEIDSLLLTVKDTYNLDSLDLAIVKSYLELTGAERSAVKNYIKKIKGT